VSKPYHICPKNPKHKAWGLYARGTGAQPNMPFVMVMTFSDHMVGERHARDMTTLRKGVDYNLQGAVFSTDLPPKFYINARN
jgi:hypothetical protein